jgi:hypothetical protein
MQLLDLNSSPQRGSGGTSVNIDHVVALQVQSEGEIEVNMAVDRAGSWKRRL